MFEHYFRKRDARTAPNVSALSFLRNSAEYKNHVVMIPSNFLVDVPGPVCRYNWTKVWKLAEAQNAMLVPRVNPSIIILCLKRTRCYALFTGAYIQLFDH